MINILIVEDDSELITEYESVCKGHPQLNLACTTSSFSNALAELNSIYPHVIILELELQRGTGNGMEFLQQVSSQEPGHIPYIIVETRSSSPTTLKCARQFGADFIFSKYEQDFSAEKVIDFILSISSAITNTNMQISYNLLNYGNTGSNMPETDSTVKPASCKFNSYESKENFFRSELKILGITPKLKGYNYLVDSVLLLSENNSREYLTIISEKYKQSVTSIERAMQNAVKNAWTRKNVDMLNSHFSVHLPSNRNYPTLKEFLYYYAEYIRG